MKTTFSPETTLREMIQKIEPTTRNGIKRIMPIENKETKEIEFVVEWD